MTACVNKKHTRRVALAISASLVGALSLGAAAPAAAFADDGIATLTGTETSAFDRGSVSLNLSTNSEGVYSVQADGSGAAIDVQATAVKPLGAAEITLSGNNDYEVTIFHADADGVSTGERVSQVVEPGNYVVVVTAVDGTYQGGSASVNFVVTSASLSEVSPYEVNPGDAQDTSDTTFTYSGSALNIGFTNSGVKLVEGADYTVKVLKKGTDNVESAPGVVVLEAGDYVAYVTGIGQYAGQSQRVDFTVSQFDMTLATIVVDDVIGSESAPQHPTRVYYNDYGASVAELDPSLVDLSFVSGPGSLFEEPGEYKFSVSWDDENVTGAAGNVTVNKVSSLASFQYDGEALGSSYYIDKSTGASFDLSAVKALEGDEELDAAAYDVSWTCDSGSGSLEDGDPGTYTVTVKVDASKAGYAVGGSVSFTVTVVEGVVDADANVYIYNADEEVVTSFSKTYDGVAVYAGGDFTAAAFDSEGNVIANAGLSLALYDSDGNRVSYASDAGEYTLRVTSSNYDLTGTTEIPVTITKVDLSTLKVSAVEDWYGASYLPVKADGSSYLWSELGILFDTHIADSDENDEQADGEGWEVLSETPDNLQADAYLKAERYDAEKGEWVEVGYAGRCKTEGDWRITLTGSEALAKNYVFANEDYTTTVEFRVVDSDKLVFNDVKPGDWFFDVVYEAQSNDWMFGYASSSVFGAEDSLTRGQMACVLYNMANSAGKIPETDLGYSEVFGYETGFSDVNGKAYYAEAIAWARQAGVVNGDAGSDTFRPDDTVTREELAAMISNYAEKVDQRDTGVDDPASVLAGYPDGSEVSGWATEVVAWAADNGVMGNGGVLSPTSDIIRAEVAAMVCNYMLG